SSILANGKTTNQTGKAPGSFSTGKNMSGTGAMRSQAVGAHGFSPTANNTAESGKRRQLGRWAGNRYRLGEEPSVLPEKECSMLRRHVCLAVSYAGFCLKKNVASPDVARVAYVLVV